ncbi:MAG: acyclic terpene utilization AtuA family protein, partial [Alphaproteobacteria bacterium]
MREDPFLIGDGAGFSGDRLDAPGPVVDTLIASGRPAAMMFEVLAERTLALAQLARRSDPDAGYEPMLDALIRPILKRCVAHAIPIVGNFGAANPMGAARLLHRIAREEGIPALTVGVVGGDDLRGTVAPEDMALWEADKAIDLARTEIIAANAYLGAFPIAEALGRGAQVVVTGRVADPALALGPLIHHFGWAETDWDRLAAGTLVGHLLECGAQVTGGYFGDPGWKDIPDPADIGFPIAEVSSDGSAVITKAAGTGGLVSARTVKEQILYEMHDPAGYLTPDVVLDVTGVDVTEVGRDRVRVSGARGRPRPATLKVTASVDGGWLGEGEITYAGINALARARMAGDTVLERVRRLGLDCEARYDLIGYASDFDGDTGAMRRAAAPEPAEVRLRVAARSADRAVADRVGREVLALYCCGPAGGGGVRW